MNDVTITTAVADTNPLNGECVRTTNCTQQGGVRCVIRRPVACDDKENQGICATLGRHNTTFLPNPELGYLSR